MDAQTLQSLITVSGVVLSAIVAATVTIALRKSEESKKRETALFRLKDPLIFAVEDLLSRLENITNQNFMYYYESGTVRQKFYAIESTTFRIARLFAMTEMARINLLFVDRMGRKESTKIYKFLIQVERKWASDSSHDNFMWFSDEQRAIGGLLITRISDNMVLCISYAEFLKEFPAGKSDLFDELRKDVKTIDVSRPEIFDRLMGVRNELFSLLNFLDPRSELARRIKKRNANVRKTKLTNELT